MKNSPFLAYLIALLGLHPSAAFAISCNRPLTEGIRAQAAAVTPQGQRFCPRNLPAGTQYTPNHKLVQTREGGMAVLHFLEDAADPTARYVIRYPKSAAVGELPGHPFEREAALLSEPLHPNIVRVLSYGKDADLGLQFQLLPWLPGRTLTQWVEARSVENVLSPAPWNAESLERVSELAKGLWSVLGTLERLNLVHRDLHPGNIMIHGNHFTVIDFTTSVRVGEEPSFAVYTKDFSAPESIEPRPASFAVDVYGWGASVLYAFTGVNPEVLRWETQHSFPRDTFRERVRQHLETIPIEAGLCFAVEPWTEVLAKALSEEPSERYPNATALAQALDRIFGGPAWRAAVPADNK